MPHVDNKLSTPRGEDVDTSLISEAERAAIWQRIIDNPKPRHPSHERPQRPTQAQREFDGDFSALVGPRLLKLIIGLAPMVKLEVYSFDGAWEQVWKLAEQCGCIQLSEETLAGLHSWIDQELLRHLDDPLPAGLVTPERLRRITGER